MSGVAFFPGAGSFGGELRPLVDALAPAASLVRYPGRFGRDAGRPAESFDDVVLACAEQLGDRRTVLFGHSFGAYVAYATAARLQDAGAEVAALVVVGATAPTRLEVPTPASPAATAAYLDEVDPAVLAAAPSDDWREIVAETAMHDLRLLAQFEAGAGLRCPMVAARGEADPLTTDEGLREWRHVTTGPFATRVFPGGHSDFLGTAGCASWLRELAGQDGTQKRPGTNE